jgi:dipeptidyl aminopeptidase/acylaminoacyl peptidase
MRAKSALSLIAAIVIAGADPGSGPSSRLQARTRAVSVDDLMALSTINDVEIAPTGDRVAYTVSTPSIPTNTHETALFMLPVEGGAPVRLGAEAKIFVPALPAPRLRWRPDGTAISFLAIADGRPQVFAVSPSGGPARALTAAPEGVSGYEWSPDGSQLAYLAREAAPPPPVANKDGSLPPATRLWIQAADTPTPARP